MSGFFFVFLATASLPAVAPPSVSPAPPTHWAFLPPRRSALPAVSAPSALDAFLLAKLRARGWNFAPEADRRTLLRRLSFDLTGLPPTPEEIAAFEADTRPDAYERQVDRLLASPHHGERWAMHWLDVARYAESNGYELDAERPHAWRYRDWVVRALNANLPYDRFLSAQIAGDLLSKDAAEGRLAVGFHRCGPIHQVSGNIDPREVRDELLSEMVSGFTGAFLGLTVRCAKCHDHKFDPISQAEYFQFEAFFARTKTAEFPLASTTELATYAKAQAAYQTERAALKLEIEQIDSPYRAKLRDLKIGKLPPEVRAAFAAKERTAAQKKLVADYGPVVKVTWEEVLPVLTPEDRERRVVLRGKLYELTRRAPPPTPQAWTVRDTPGERRAAILKRGDYKRPGREVSPGYPAVFPRSPQAAQDRRDLADWFTRRDHPLTARVMVNRLWQHHFGQGIVRTPNDFGIKGDAPSHPELLDWLALEFIESGWDIKHLHRLMVLSQAYRQASNVPVPREVQVQDPGNRLLSRMNRRRLEGEALRDAQLAVSGQLTPWLHGPMVRVPLEPEVYDLIFTEDEPDGLWPVDLDERQHTRRSLYLFAKRNVRQPILEAFDQPDTLHSCPVRPVSTFAPQALILLNGPQTNQAALALASRIATATDPVDRLYRLTLGRAPTPREATTAKAFLTEQTALLRDELRARKPLRLPAGPADADPAHLAALADLSLAMLNRSAFVVVD
jgi:hypothetical protein